MGLLAVPGSVGRAGLHCRDDMHQAGMVATFGQHLGNHVLFADVAVGNVFDGNAGSSSQLGGALTHAVTKRLGKSRMVLTERGDHPGLVHVISAMEACPTYRPWHSKQTHRTLLRPATGKCLHYYFYFIDAELGLIYLRVPTWCPFRLQFYCNGHSWLARQLTAAGIGFTLPTTPLCASTMGSGRRPWPISSHPPSCIRSSIAMPGSAVPCSTSSRRPTTGA